MKQLFLFSMLVAIPGGAAPVVVNNISDMVFPDGNPGDPTYTIANVESETPENASFAVTGDAGARLNTSLPASATMTTTAPGPQPNIDVTAFRLAPRNPQLDGSGNVTVFVSAKRAALDAAQNPGFYTTNFTVDIIYK